MKAIIRKEGWIPSRPWCADLITDKGIKWSKWQHGFKTRTALEQAINAANPSIECVRDKTADII